MRRDREADEAAVVDLSEILMDYAGKYRDKDDHLAEQLSHITIDDLTQLDDLLQDGGVSRREFQAVATGYLRDKYRLEGSELATARDDLLQAALHYLATHTAALDAWEN